MDAISPSDLKTILHSKRANTTVLLLGTGTSLTQAAMHKPDEAGFLVENAAPKRERRERKP